ncbi:MAG: hypothetical protein MK133_03900, partial [Planctomycetes bacterium]|nr:hypothetical protein [Planctomycetota bacterium]
PATQPEFLGPSELPKTAGAEKLPSGGWRKNPLETAGSPFIGVQADLTVFLTGHILLWRWVLGFVNRYQADWRLGQL